MKATLIEPVLPPGDAPEVSEIRAIRAAVSAECDDDPWKLVESIRDFQILPKRRRHVGGAAIRRP